MEMDYVPPRRRGRVIVLLGLAVMVSLLRKRHVAKIEAIERAEAITA